MTRVAIIGAGIIGLATAYELQRRGASVTLVDPRPPGTAASSGNAGWIVPVLSGPVPSPGLPRQVFRWSLRSDSPFRIDLRQARDSAHWLFQFWRHCSPSAYHRGLRALGALNVGAWSALDRWRSEGLAFEYGSDGVLFVSRDPHHIEHLVSDMDALADHGYEPVDWVTQPLLHEIEPALASSIDCGVLAPLERHVRPESLASALLDSVRSDGARFVYEPVDDNVRIRNRAVAEISANDVGIEADAFVLAAGAWSGAIGERFGLRLPVIAGKGYSITVSDPEMHLQQPLYLADARIACTPFEGATRFAGMMELTGTDDRVDPARLATMVSALERDLPGWDRGSRRSVWAGLRPMTPDGLPLIGKAPGLHNVYIATGHGMLGMTQAPVSAEIIADLITAGAARRDIAPFDPGRF